MIGRAAARRVAASLFALALCGGAGRTAARAQTTDSFAAYGAVRIEARFVDRASGREALWGVTGQILVPPEPADPALARWPQVREIASSPSRQTVLLEPRARGFIRVGREIPFAGWFLRHGTSCGRLEEGAEWREVESALEITLLPAADGTLLLALTPEFGYQQGRSRRTVAFSGERVETRLSPGTEAQLVAPPELEPFYRRLIAGYDPLRRVWPVDLFLRADFVGTAATANTASTSDTAAP